MLRSAAAPPSIRRKAAEGGLPVSLEEKIEILAALCDDSDKATRAAALKTLKNWDTAELKKVLSNPGVSVGVLELAVRRLLPERPELEEALAANPGLPVSLQGLIKGREGESAVPTAGPGDYDDDESLPERQTLLQKINRMTVPEKINAALMGNQEERMILVRDANKVVARSVLQSPKLSDQEVENIATMKNVSEEVLRLVGMNRKFIRNYAVARNLVNNPRTPIDIGLPLINRLNDRDLKELSRNKNVAEVVRGMAAKLIRQKEEANKPRLPGKR
ncbi:MAG TPA: hypothetical protein VFC10_02185 [Terriglobia bacterium]|jgi:hypothetical protein|nr:hypothetical protein [Terriglobia bacterium]